MITKAKLLKLIEESVPDNNSIDISMHIETERDLSYTVQRLEIRYLVKNMFPQIINTEK